MADGVAPGVMDGLMDIDAFSLEGSTRCHHARTLPPRRERHHASTCQPPSQPHRAVTRCFGGSTKRTAPYARRGPSVVCGHGYERGRHLPPSGRPAPISTAPLMLAVAVRGAAAAVLERGDRVGWWRCTSGRPIRSMHSLSSSWRPQPASTRRLPDHYHKNLTVVPSRHATHPPRPPTMPTHHAHPRPTIRPPSHPPTPPP